MTINGRRSFKFNGRKYYVENTMKADRTSESERYFLTEVDSNGIHHCLHHALGMDLVKFATIKDAQRFVMNWDFLLVAV